MKRITLNIYENNNCEFEKFIVIDDSVGEIYESSEQKAIFGIIQLLANRYNNKLNIQVNNYMFSEYSKTYCKI